MNKEINTQFNIKATLAMWFVSIITLFVTEDIDQSDNPSTALQFLVDSLVARMIITLFFWVIIMLVLSKLFKEVWNRLIFDVFQLRKISFSEAYAFSVVMTWVVWF